MQSVPYLCDYGPVLSDNGRSAYVASDSDVVIPAPWIRLPRVPIAVYRYLSPKRKRDMSGLFVGCFTSQQQASVSQGRICSDKFTCCHTEIEVADQTFYLTQSQYTDTGPTSPSDDPITPDAWQGSHWSVNV